MRTKLQRGTPVPSTAHGYVSAVRWREKEWEQRSRGWARRIHYYAHPIHIHC